MLIKKEYLVLFIILLSSLQSCKSKDEICTKDITNSTKTIEELYNCTTTFENLSLISKEDSYLIITTKNEYDSKVVGSCHPEIDFGTYNLLIGYSASTKKVSSVKNRLYQSCETNVYNLETTITSQENTGQITFFTYHLLVPKTEQIDELKVVFLQSN